jgi:hypothetical protein
MSQLSGEEKSLNQGVFYDKISLCISFNDDLGINNHKQDKPNSVNVIYQ